MVSYCLNELRAVAYRTVSRISCKACGIWRSGLFDDVLIVTPRTVLWPLFEVIVTVRLVLFWDVTVGCLWFRSVAYGLASLSPVSCTSKRFALSAAACLTESLETALEPATWSGVTATLSVPCDSRLSPLSLYFGARGRFWSSVSRSAIAGTLVGGGPNGVAVA